MGSGFDHGSAHMLAQIASNSARLQHLTESGRHIARRLESLCRVLAEGAVHDLHQLFGNVTADRPQGLNLTVTELRKDF